MSSTKQKRPVKLTLESLRAHDAIEKPRSPMKRFTSNADPYGRFAATGSSGRRGLDVERGLKEHQRGYSGGNVRGAESSRNGHQRGIYGGDGRAAESSNKSQKQDFKQKEVQSRREQDRWGRYGGWYRG